MLDIPGIGSEQVRLYGRKFLPLIQNAKRGYEAMMDSEKRPQDPNHQNVINISTDEGEDFGAEEGPDGLEDHKDSQGERSQYFQHDEEVEAFNARCKSDSIKQGSSDNDSVGQVQTQAASRAPQSNSNDSRPKNIRGGFKKRRKPREASGAGKSKASSGVTKKQGPSNRGSSSSFNFGPPSKGGGASGAIGMMPL